MDCVNHSRCECNRILPELRQGTLRHVACATRPAGRFFANHAGWHHGRAINSLSRPHPGGPNPAVAAVLGLIPGVGAMYNGQFIKGLIHVVIFAVLVSAAISMESSASSLPHGSSISRLRLTTPRARRDGLPLPDPLGLNEVGNWLNPGHRPQYPGQPGVGPNPQNPGSHRWESCRPEAGPMPAIRLLSAAVSGKLFVGPESTAVPGESIHHRIRRPRGLPIRPCHPFHRCPRFDGGARSRSARLS
jgi:hypothetical protein